MAIAIGTVVMMFSYFPYARAFAVPEGAPPAIDVPLVGMALAVAPFVFVAVGFVSQNPKAPRHVLQAMGLLLVLGLGLGLLSPVLGASAGFAAGGAITLNRAPLYDLMRYRVIAVALERRLRLRTAVGDDTDGGARRWARPVDRPGVRRRVPLLEGGSPAVRPGEPAQGSSVGTDSSTRRAGSSPIGLVIEHRRSGGRSGRRRVPIPFGAQRQHDRHGQDEGDEEQ